MEDKFKYTYSAPNAEEKKEIMKIQSQYLQKERDPKDENLTKLKKLDKVVKLPAKIISIILGIIGFTCFGIGMTMSLEWNIILWGAILGITGIALMAVSYPIYNKIFAKRKAKYAGEILEISKSLLQEDKQDNVELDIKQVDEEV